MFQEMAFSSSVIGIIGTLCISKKWRFSKDFLIRLKNGVIFQADGKWRYKNGTDNKVIILYNIIGGGDEKKAPEMAPQGAPFGSLINCAATYFSSPAPVSSSYCES